MYQLVYYHKEIIDNRLDSYKKYAIGKFRLKRNALHYLFDVIQSDYRKDDYGTEQFAGGINCYKSEKIENEGRKIIEVTIKVEKA